ncbi:hypothetical protein CDAR_124172 [Caerostris darwini]|uniref:Fibronectin type-III domain-containing protein n=1 Tax=Caerostris darwini TaxID=1538125 RepID=A0AAV4R5A7_9ARAC|nr:hypothetical protein CDAR_124172 [Caerostris darwini]
MLYYRVKSGNEIETVSGNTGAIESTPVKLQAPNGKALNKRSAVFGEIPVFNHLNKLLTVNVDKVLKKRSALQDFPSSGKRFERIDDTSMKIPRNSDNSKAAYFHYTIDNASDFQPFAKRPVSFREETDMEYHSDPYPVLHNNAKAVPERIYDKDDKSNGNQEFDSENLNRLKREASPDETPDSATIDNTFKFRKFAMDDALTVEDTLQDQKDPLDQRSADDLVPLVNEEEDKYDAKKPPEENKIATKTFPDPIEVRNDAKNDPVVTESNKQTESSLKFRKEEFLEDASGKSMKNKQNHLNEEGTDEYAKLKIVKVKKSNIMQKSKGDTITTETFSDVIEFRNGAKNISDSKVVESNTKTDGTFKGQIKDEISFRHPLNIPLDKSSTEKPVSLKIDKEKTNSKKDTATEIPPVGFGFRQEVPNVSANEESADKDSKTDENENKDSKTDENESKDSKTDENENNDSKPDESGNKAADSSDEPKDKGTTEGSKDEGSPVRPRRPGIKHIKKTEIVLTWSTPKLSDTPVPQSYSVEQRDEEGVWQIIGFPSVPSLRIKNLTPRHTYLFKISSLYGKKLSTPLVVKYIMDDPAGDYESDVIDADEVMKKRQRNT